ncbi:MAG: SidA/IucD/PvdA family monooxygenase [Streptosporangiales bacterium]|nr:SidA/IucD/PvdA family monooxygenase [Streptosporangiales bacterium]
MTQRTPLSVLIIGAGFGGVGMAIRLTQAGVRDFVVVEKGDGPGGTWRDNTYPGAACDIPSHLYSFSFEPKTDWSRRYPSQGEILDYLRHCVRKYRLEPHIRYGTAVTSAEYGDEAGVWTVRTESGDDYRARVVVSACGQLNRPRYPDLPGREDFAGTAFHSARWRHDHDLTGRRVAVIGTGASAIQFIPPVAEQAERTYVFQRSAPYVIAKPDRPYGTTERTLLRAMPGLRALTRGWQYAQHEARAVGFVTFTRALRPYEAGFRRRLGKEVPDPERRRALLPDYPIGCKRVLISNDFYPAMNRPDVELVTDPIERLSADGVVTADGTYAVDTVIYGTGFQATDFLAPMKIIGRGGAELAETWRSGAHAYLGLAVSGFPNMFLLYGPNTNLGHNSIIYMLESQFRYVLGCLDLMRRTGLRALEVRPEVADAYDRRLRRLFGRTIWDQGCTSWYKTADGRITNNWPGYTFAYRRRTRRPDPEAFLAQA